MACITSCEWDRIIGSHKGAELECDPKIWNNRRAFEPTQGQVTFIKMFYYIYTLVVPNFDEYQMQNTHENLSGISLSGSFFYELSHDMRFPTMWYVRPAKPQISLRKCAVWSEPLLVTLISCVCLAIDWTPCGVFKLKSRLLRLTWVYTCQNATLLEITCHGSFYRW